MKPIIIKSDKILDRLGIFFRIGGITLIPFIIVRPNVNKTTIHHETIHIRQAWELFVIPFYLIYLWDWLWGLWKYKDTQVAYQRIRFEQEAYDNERKWTYLDKRTPYQWRKYKV